MIQWKELVPSSTSLESRIEDAVWPKTLLTNTSIQLLVAYLRHTFSIDDAEHRAIARSLDRNLEQVVHRTVTEDIRMRLDDSMERISSIVDEFRVKN